VSDVVDERLVVANTEFGFRLFAEVAELDRGKNIFLSPASVAMALAMTYNGARGATQEAMAETLGLEGMSLQEANQSNAALRKSMEDADPDVEILIANSLWMREGTDFYPEFLDRNRQFFGAEVAALDFGDPKASDAINSWVADSTRGRITEIVDKQIDPQTVLFLINAIYFNGAWAIEFDESKTQEMPFYLPDGGQKPVPMMSQSGDYLYHQGDGFQVVVLPYGDGRLGAYIFLPDPDSSLGSFLAGLSADNWEMWLSQLHMMEGDVALPRFGIEYEINLNEALKAMGMAVAFDPARADLSGMRPVPPNLFIQKVKHKAFVQVNEQGTEAAAVTSVEIGITSVREKFRFVADRPFFFAIGDAETGSILFMGTVVEPQV
jgi:serpin B